MNIYFEWFDYPYKRWRNYGEDGAPFTERDFQRQKCYDAENLFFSLMKDRLQYTLKRFESIKEIQEYVNKICTRSWFKRRWNPEGTCIIHVEDGRERSSASGGFSTLRYGWITLPMWARNEVVIVHELAHAVTPPSTGGKHGRFWARSFLELVRFVIGEDSAKLLREAYKMGRVKYNPKRILSEEAKTAARERFVKNYLKREIK